MNIRTISQPNTRLGDEIDELLKEKFVYSRIVLVSAFVALRTILRLRDRLLSKVERGASLWLTVGIDLGGTSREVLYELLRWNCGTFVFHNPFKRSTFHPKFYLFEGSNTATLFIGSNNLTDGGFYTNYEASTRYDFNFPSDTSEYQRLITPLIPFYEPPGDTIQPLNERLINILVARNELLSEAQARQRRQTQDGFQGSHTSISLSSPFALVAIPRAPLLDELLRAEEMRITESQLPVRSIPQSAISPQPSRCPLGTLVWRKKLPATDALQTKKGSHHVGGVRLTQARFRDSQGNQIDQTRYFRQLFSDYHWESESDHQVCKEHAFVPMRIIIRERDHGIHNFEISHKPSGEAGQSNYTTILRWGRNFTPTVLAEKLSGMVFSLYENEESDATFLIDIREP